MADLRIEVASHAGVCYGVERALKLAAHAAESARGSVTTLGPLIHNPIVVRDLESAGVKGAQTVDEVESGTLIIRAHGVVPQVIDQARAKGLEVLDATCPYVKKVHMAAEKLVREGYQLIVVGESGHPEVEGILGHAGDAAHVVSTPHDLDGVDLARKVGVVVQTTQTPANLAAIVSALALRTMDLRVVNTICSATQERQDSAAELASRADVMIVIGGKNSGNTRRLAEICMACCPRTHHIEDSSEIQRTWFEGVALVGITAGASTPGAHIDAALACINRLLEP
ncbi:4-hydroxy-3-methylbut-2-enyl diphosphate reductase [uncultured Collinsella sp.]|uniref:4-hydroxy-3-methylbut-2-enyl diphosphate reductase n=1 Tax=uncultured Collinsella sp. TaxID=165190 RepID=UPI0025F8F127|nr:4-hydroxy-3-methylbut-2-enyl diphosphate reductase [uncultured Collinsella sp.]